jgi:hypothetical protein
LIDELLASPSRATGNVIDAVGRRLPVVGASRAETVEAAGVEPGTSAGLF